MVSDNARLVLRFAAMHVSFRAALRSNPREAIKDYANDLKLSGDLTLDEMDALVSVTDEEYEVMKRIGAAFNDPLDNSVALTSGSII